MKRISSASLVLLAASFIGVFAIPSVSAGTTTSTSTIFGWLFPDSAHLANTLIAVMFPLMGAAFMSLFLMVMGRKGDMGAHAILFGMLLGAISGDLTTGVSTIGAISFGNIVIIGVSWALYWWNS